MHLASGAALALLAAWGLHRDVEAIAQPFYAYAWWSYILIADGFCAFLRGRSLLTTRWRHLLPLSVASVSFWFFFELLNVRFQNWYYVGAFPAETLLGVVGGGIFVFVCFSTVFVGIFETIEAVHATGLWRRWDKHLDRRFPRIVSYLVQVGGALMAFLAVCFPHYLAPLIWGSFTFLVDPWNYRRGARSLLKDVEMGRWGALARIFAAGLFCGLLWESLNFFAPQKWIYTVRGLESFKLFEMPLLGFLGFPALAFDSLAGYSFFSSIFLGNQTWEDPSDVGYELETSPAQWWVFWWMLPFHCVGWAVVGLLVINVNIGSLQLELEHLSIEQREVAALRDAGIRRPRQLLRRVGDDEQRVALRERLGWSPERLDGVVEEARLFAFKGIGREFGTLLQRAGIRRVEDLRGEDETALHRRLQSLALASGSRSPRLDMVRVWVLASRADSWISWSPR